MKRKAGDTYRPIVHILKENNMNYCPKCGKELVEEMDMIS